MYYANWNNYCALRYLIMDIIRFDTFFQNFGLRVFQIFQIKNVIEYFFVLFLHRLIVHILVYI